MPSLNIVFLDVKTVGDVPNLDRLEQFGSVVYYQTTEPAQTRERILDADIVITNKVVLDRALLEQAPRLKLICVAATGTNNVDKDAAAERGIPVKNVRDYSTRSVAQVTFATLLHLLNQVPYYDAYVKQGGYAQNDIFTHFGPSFWELGGKRFGIIGLGTIGRQVANIADAFGAEVVYFSTSGQNNDQPYARLEWTDFLRTTDVISIHAPLNERTANLIRYEGLKQMKKSAILLNVGRGGIVNEAHLARALDDELIAGAGIDVFEQEPIDPKNPLLTVRNPDKLVLTPHVAWASVEARTRLIELISRNIDEFLKEGK